MQTYKSPQSPYFSIVIPTYNREELIFETLETVFNQTFQDFEIIVVDNASTDNSLEKLQKLVEQKKIRLIANEKNMERSIARNIGMKAASGQYLTLLDSDDFMYPDALSDSKKYIEENPEIKFFHNYFDLVTNDRKRLSIYKSPPKNNQIKKLAEGNFISCIGVFLSREVYQEFHFNEDEKILGSEDWELWVRVISSYELGVIRKVNFGVRNHESRSLSAYDIESIVTRKEYIIDHLFKNKQVEKVFGKYKLLMRSSALIFAAVFANQSKQFSQAKQILKRALELNPKLILKPRFLRVAQIAQFKIDKTLK